jgi:hypothetical protein
MNNKYSTLGFDKIYVINLKRRPDRKKAILEANPEIDFTFIEAVDGKELNIDQLLSEGKINKSFFDPSGMVTMGVYACALSHKKAWDQALQDGVSNALFLEDDIFLTMELVLNGDLTPVYKEVLSEIDEFDWDILHLGKKHPTSEGINVGNYWVVPRYNSNYNGAHAYSVTNSSLKILTNNYLPISYAADVYLEQYTSTLNVFTIKQSLIQQHSDQTDNSLADSDTYYNEYREGGGNIGISFDQNGNVLNKKIVKYIKHPIDITKQYTESVLGSPKFGEQLITSPNNINTSLFSILDLLKTLSCNLEPNSKMVEINSHLGESTFFFGCSGLFSNIYAVDPLSGEDKFNLDNDMTWKDIEVGFHCNTYLHKNISHIKNQPEKVVNSFKDISFLYINNRKKEDISKIIKLYYPILKETAYIGGNNIEDKIEGSTVFEDGSWLIKKPHIYNKIIRIN